MHISAIVTFSILSNTMGPSILFYFCYTLYIYLADVLSVFNLYVMFHCFYLFIKLSFTKTFIIFKNSSCFFFILEHIRYKFLIPIMSIEKLYHISIFLKILNYISVFIMRDVFPSYSSEYRVESVIISRFSYQGNILVFISIYIK